MVISARLMGKEIYRKKLKWFDLRKADYRLGKKAYENGLASEQTQHISRLDQLRDRLARLRKDSDTTVASFSDKAKALARAVARGIQTGTLNIRRRRILAELGASVRQRGKNGSLEEETKSARTLAKRIALVDTDIGQLASRTYPWARRPLLLACVALLFTTLGLSWVQTRRPKDVSASDNTTGDIRFLSEQQLATIQAQRMKQALQRQAEMGRQEDERMQARIAAAERQHKEQRDRERAEVKEMAREQAQRDEQTRREQAVLDKQQAQIAAAEQARLEREQAEAEKLAREKAERERAEAERAAAAERVQKEEEQRVTQIAEERRQREEDKRAAQKTPASHLIAKSDLEAIMGFSMLAPEDRKVEGVLTKKQLPGVEEASSCFFASTLPKTERSFNGVMLTVRYLNEKDGDRAEMVTRETMGRREFGSPDLFFAYIPELGYGGFFYRDLYCKASDSIFVFRPTLRGCTLLQVGIDGAPSEESSGNIHLWHEHMVDRERKIALKILGPPRVKVASYEERHPSEHEKTQSNYLPDIPGVDAGAMRFFNGMFKDAAKAENDNIASSKRIVAASGETKRLCPKCGGTKKMVQHTYDSGGNPYAHGTLGHSLRENGREGINIVNCDNCGGTGVVNAR
ncbi:MAG: hypothetical protein ABI925_06310 [Verrucomicrobiota bacterium]